MFGPNETLFKLFIKVIVENFSDFISGVEIQALTRRAAFDILYRTVSLSCPG
jgi:hypothetical protein